MSRRCRRRGQAGALARALIRISLRDTDTGAACTGRHLGARAGERHHERTPRRQPAAGGRDMMVGLNPYRGPLPKLCP